MKKFLLSIFVIGAITMAQLPSILCCGSRAEAIGSNYGPPGYGKRSVGSKGN